MNRIMPQSEKLRTSLQYTIVNITNAAPVAVHLRMRRGSSGRCGSRRCSSHSQISVPPSVLRNGSRLNKQSDRFAAAASVIPNIRNPKAASRLAAGPARRIAVNRCSGSSTVPAASSRIPAAEIRRYTGFFPIIAIISRCAHSCSRQAASVRQSAAGGRYIESNAASTGAVKSSDMCSPENLKQIIRSALVFRHKSADICSKPQKSPVRRKHRTGDLFSEISAASHASPPQEIYAKHTPHYV